MVWAYPAGKVAALLLSRATGDGPGNKNGVARWETFIGGALVVLDPVGAGVLMAHGYVRAGASDEEGFFSPGEKKVCRTADKVIQTGIAIKSAGTLGDKLTG
jgi:hypothetical protein